MDHSLKYCNDLFSYSRFITREVKAGVLGIGGNNPIRLQSMTTTLTLDTRSTVEQSIRMIQAGCELVRITAPNINDAKNLENIKKGLRAKGFNTPICADIHFTPNAAEIAARLVEKVRINPGNYADRKKFETIEYSERSYDEELERIRERFTPLVRICKENGTAMRIGTNHGSLSDRILSRYGDTPLGMVESAMEFVSICEENDFREIVISMKASNTRVMVQAYRMLVNRMITNGQNYPLHLGVTEAGEGEDGRIKSAMGIGSLLEDGLGDTIRVSLTEEPEFELPVAKIIANRYRDKNDKRPSTEIQPEEKSFSPFEYVRRSSNEVLNFGGQNVPRVIADLSYRSELKPASLFSVGYNYSVPLDKWNITDQACDYIYLGKNKIDFAIPGTLGLILDHDVWSTQDKQKNSFPLFYNSNEYHVSKQRSAIMNFVMVDAEQTAINFDKTVVIVIKTIAGNAMQCLRNFFFNLATNNILQPAVIMRAFANITEEERCIHASVEVGGLLVDGFGDGVFLSDKSQGIDHTKINSTAFGILQASRTRISKTEYISCPSCGRTLFDLQETTAKIRKRTDHLKGVKIGIMGCIVNGPGEMADADYGYVGTGPGKITLYKGKEVIKRNIPSESAVDQLIELIKSGGDWVEKQ